MRPSSALLTILAAMTTATSPMAQNIPYTTRYDGDGMITVNGSRTFILGTYHRGTRDDTRSIQEQFVELKHAGFNLVNAGADTAEQAAAAGAGLMTWVGVGTLDLDKLDESNATLRQAVEAARDLPAVAFLETVDEPAWTWKSAQPRVQATALAQAYPVIKEVDPHHLVYTNHAPVNLISTMQAYNGGTDIVACDIYPVNPGGLREMYALNDDGYQGDLNNNEISQVGQYTRKMREVAGPHRPVVIVLQGFAWEMLRDAAERDPAKVLYPTYEQTRFMAYQAIINGANGIIYWGTSYTPQPSPFWNDLKKVVGEIAGFAPVLATPEVEWPLTIEYHEMGHSVDLGIETLVKQHDGALYVFTCNADKNPCKATIRGLEGWVSRRGLIEGTIGEQGLTDMWKPFEVHVYVLKR